jgi:hypothetical protein
MSRVVALKSHSYLQRWRPKGESYDAKKRDVPILEAAKLARRSLERQPDTIAPFRSIVSIAEPEPVIADACVDQRFPVVESTKPKRRYRRRDLMVED